MEKNNESRIFTLSLGALGVVYGDLGTSPLYAFQQTLPYLPISTEAVLGVLSIVFWSLILIISTCYVTVFLRADNDGEGGILALVALLKRQVNSLPRFLFWMGVIGAGLLLGDGMLTPAVSVISAIEGLKVISPSFSYLILPIAFVILFLLFFSQRFGSARIGFTFGPILLCWFIVIGALGIVAIFRNPIVLRAVNPYYAFVFLYHGGKVAYLTLSGIFLVITGAEAMYADLGHFGKTSIRLSWFSVVLPMLLLNYFGQGANLLQHPDAIANTFYALSPPWFSYPLLVFAAIATIIASQAVITASFSLARQAILLNVLPRLSIIHTSEDEKGQVYVPQMNFILGLGTLSLVIVFKSSHALAAAYGISVNLVMLIVAILMVFVARLLWKWSYAKILLVFSLFIFIELVYLTANFHKIYQGAWIPLVFAAIIGLVMLTWDKGMRLLRSSYYMNKVALPDIKKELQYPTLHYIENLTAIFIADPYDKSGGSFLHYLKLNHILPKEALILSVNIEDYPYITDKNRYELKKIDDNIYQLILHYGFMQSIDVPRSLIQAEKINLFPFPLDINQATYFVEDINVTITKKKYPFLFYWQKKLFGFLLRNSALDVVFYRLPLNRTIAIGSCCEI